MRRLSEALAGVSRLGLDTAPVIYYVEAHPRYDPLVTAVFDAIRDGELTAFTSVITFCEVLIQPFRRGNTDLEDEYRDILLNSEHFFMLQISLDIAERAAELRAQYNLRLPDALQVATALRAGCQALLTNDAGLQRVTDLDVLVLDDLEV